MSYNLRGHFQTGLAPSEFVDSMTRNQETFQNWYSEFTWPGDGERSFFETFSGKQKVRCLIIAADWCGDVVRNVPVVLHLTETAKIPTEILIMEQNLEVIDAFLTLGGRSIPVVLFVDESGEVLAKWGPRPAHVQEPMADFKALKIPKESPEYDEKIQVARAEVRRRYGEGTAYQKDIVREIREILESLA